MTTTMPQMDNAIGIDPDKPQQDGTVENSHNLDIREYSNIAPLVDDVIGLF